MASPLPPLALISEGELLELVNREKPGAQLPVQCPCGHRGSIIESFDDEAPPADAWRFSCLRDLNHDGDYERLDALFADTTRRHG